MRNLCFPEVRSGKMNKVRYARISLTPYCPLKCRYCISGERNHGAGERELLSWDEILRLIDIMGDAGVKKFRFTGGEPFSRKGVMGFFRRLNLENWGVTTSLSVKGIASRINDSSVDNINVSLDTLDAKKYRWLTRGGSLDVVLENLNSLRYKKIKLNTILIKGFNVAEAEDIIKFAHERNFIPRFIEKMDLFSGTDGLQTASVSLLGENLAGKGIVSGTPFREGNSAAVYRVSPLTGLPVGFITPLSSPFCSLCDRVRVTAWGGLKSCLFSEPELLAFPALKYGRKRVEKIIKEFIKIKSPCRQETSKDLAMSGIGG